MMSAYYVAADYLKCCCDVQACRCVQLVPMSKKNKNGANAELAS